MQEPITGEHPVLVALHGPLEGRRWIVKGDIEIGRELGCTIPIEDRQVSRHHARLYISNGRCILEDLGSKNGTYHTGTQIETAVPLSDGDIIQVALIQKFAFYSSDATMPMDEVEPSRLPQSEGLLIDRKSRRVWVGNKELIPPLSAAQFRLMLCLYEQSGKVVSRNDLIQSIWQDEQAVGVSEQALDALIRRLRERIEEVDDTRQYIVTIRGHGIRLEVNP